MTPDDFRRVALQMPDVVEGNHMTHTDFRVGRKIIATLGYPDEQWGMVKLTPEQQEMLVAADPALFRPAAGAWGKRGSTQVRLDALDEATARSAIGMARRNIGSV